VYSQELRCPDCKEIGTRGSACGTTIGHAEGAVRSLTIILVVLGLLGIGVLLIPVVVPILCCSNRKKARQALATYNEKVENYTFCMKDSNGKGYKTNVTKATTATTTALKAFAVCLTCCAPLEDDSCCG